VYATAKNITEEKRLRELNLLTSKLARIGSWEIDVVANKLYWSNMLYEIHETTPEEFNPDLETGINLYREEYRSLVSDTIAKTIETGESFDIEAVLITFNNNERWIRAIGEAEMVNGKCIRIYGSFQDIHDRKEAELRLQSLANNLPGVVFQYLIHPDGTDEIKYVTKGAEQVWGLSPQEAIENIELVWNQIKLGGDLDLVKQSIAESIQNKTKWTARWKNVMPNGEIHYNLGYGSPSFLTDGTVLFNSIVLDITQEAKNEEMLEEVTEMAKIGSWELDLINQNSDAMLDRKS